MIPGKYRSFVFAGLLLSLESSYTTAEEPEPKQGIFTKLKERLDINPRTSFFGQHKWKYKEAPNNWGAAPASRQSHSASLRGQAAKTTATTLATTLAVEPRSAAMRESVVGKEPGAGTTLHGGRRSNSAGSTAVATRPGKVSISLTKNESATHSTTSRTRRPCEFCLLETTA